jgi:Fe-S cluster assembly ATP-binding protein
MSKNPLLEIRGLTVKVDNCPILNGVNLTFEQGKIYAILGPNASGKSTIARTVIGLPDYKVIDGDILFEGAYILESSITERAQMGN